MIMRSVARGAAAALAVAVLDVPVVGTVAAVVLAALKSGRARECFLECQGCCLLKSPMRGLSPYRRALADPPGLVGPSRVTSPGGGFKGAFSARGSESVAGTG